MLLEISAQQLIACEAGGSYAAAQRAEGVCRSADALERGGRSGNERQRADGALDALCFAARTD